MNSEKNSRDAAQKQVKLSLSLATINKILVALGHLPYNQVHDVIADIREQTELMLATDKLPVANDIKNYEHDSTNS